MTHIVQGPAPEMKKKALRRLTHSGEKMMIYNAPELCIEENMNLLFFWKEQLQGQRGSWQEYRRARKDILLR
jgi:hypothetical protein